MPPLTDAPTPELLLLGVGVGFGFEEVLVGLLEQATAIQIKEQSIKLKPSIFFMLASLTFELR